MKEIDFKLAFMHDNALKISLFFEVIFDVIFFYFLLQNNLMMIFLFVILSLVAILAFYYRWSTLKIFVKTSDVIEATIAQTFTSNNLARINLTYEFKEEIYTYSQSTFSTIFVKRLENGQQVELLIDHKNPKRVYIKDLLCKE